MIQILIADSQPATTAIVRYFIRRTGLPMEIIGSVQNGAEAERAIAELNPDLILLDVQLQELDGFELMRRQPGRRYILVTAYDSFSVAQQALRLGAKDILLKPLDMSELEAAVTGALGWRFTGNGLTDEIVRYIRLHYAEKVELNELARQHFTTPSHISRTFRHNMNTTVLEYLHSVRIERAAYLLENTSMSIREISEACGYENLNNFYLHFRRKENCTPTEYGAAHRHGGN